MKHTPESTTHWACQKRLEKDGGNSKCCSCHPHDDCGDTGDNPQKPPLMETLMIQPTIKKKMESVIEVLAGYVTHFEMSGRNNAEEYIEKSRVELRDFARLVCEAMTGKKDRNPCGPYCGQDRGDGGSCPHEGYNDRIEEEKQKAQEILKALE